MFTKEELTEERVQAVVAALEEESDGVARRVAAAKSEGDKELESKLAGRAKEIAGEVSAWKARGKSAPKAETEPVEE